MVVSVLAADFKQCEKKVLDMIGGAPKNSTFNIIYMAKSVVWNPIGRRAHWHWPAKAARKLVGRAVTLTMFFGRFKFLPHGFCRPFHCCRSCPMSLCPGVKGKTSKLLWAGSVHLHRPLPPQSSTSGSLEKQRGLWEEQAPRTTHVMFYVALINTSTHTKATLRSDVTRLCSLDSFVQGLIRRPVRICRVQRIYSPTSPFRFVCNAAEQSCRCLSMSYGFW